MPLHFFEASPTFLSTATLSSRWFHEFDVKNRVRGDAVFASLSFPL
jgi:hypothetical protein